MEITAGKIYKEIESAINHLKREMIIEILTSDKIRIVDSVDEIADIIDRMESVKQIFHDYIFEGILPEEEYDDEDEDEPEELEETESEDNEVSNSDS